MGDRRNACSMRVLKTMPAIYIIYNFENAEMDK